MRRRIHHQAGFALWILATGFLGGIPSLYANSSSGSAQSEGFLMTGPGVQTLIARSASGRAPDGNVNYHEPSSWRAVPQSYTIPVRNNMRNIWYRVTESIRQFEPTANPPRVVDGTFRGGIRFRQNVDSRDPGGSLVQHPWNPSTHKWAANRLTTTGWVRRATGTPVIWEYDQFSSARDTESLLEWNDAIIVTETDSIHHQHSGSLILNKSIQRAGNNVTLDVSTQGSLGALVVARPGALDPNHTISTSSPDANGTVLLNRTHPSWTLGTITGFGSGGPVSFGQHNTISERIATPVNPSGLTTYYLYGANLASNPSLASGPANFDMPGVGLVEFPVACDFSTTSGATHDFITSITATPYAAVLPPYLDWVDTVAFEREGFYRTRNERTVILRAMAVQFMGPNGTVVPHGDPGETHYDVMVAIPDPRPSVNTVHRRWFDLGNNLSPQGNTGISVNFSAPNTTKSSGDPLLPPLSPRFNQTPQTSTGFRVQGSYSGGYAVQFVTTAFANNTALPNNPALPESLWDSNRMRVFFGSYFRGIRTSGNYTNTPDPSTASLSGSIIELEVVPEPTIQTTINAFNSNNNTFNPNTTNAAFGTMPSALNTAAGRNARRITTDPIIRARVGKDQTEFYDNVFIVGIVRNMATNQARVVSPNNAENPEDYYNAFDPVTNAPRIFEFDVSQGVTEQGEHILEIWQYSPVDLGPFPLDGVNPPIGNRNSGMWIPAGRSPNPHRYGWRLAGSRQFLYEGPILSPIQVQGNIITAQN
jgi:hypothetical protein